MCIYCNSNNYRKIYENHIGPIPKDSHGRTYDIHHKDGDHSNNNPSNLIAVTVKEHYDIHFKQQDYGACWLITRNMKLSPEEKSELARLNAKKRVEDGTHPFLNGDLSRQVQLNRVENGTHPFLNGETSKKIQKKRVEDGTHHFLNKEWHKQTQKKRVEDGTHNFLGDKNPNHKKIANGTHNFLDSDFQRKTARKRVEDGTHHFLNKEAATKRALKRLENGAHTSQIKKTCNHCGKTISSNMFARWHGDNCKNKF